MKVYAYILLLFYLLGMQPQGREHVCTCEKTAEVNTCQQDKEMTSCCATNVRDWFVGNKKGYFLKKN
jgi:hypothetical protein